MVVILIFLILIGIVDIGIVVIVYEGLILVVVGNVLWLLVYKK